MTGWMTRVAMASVLTMITTPIVAQESTNNVATTKNWSVFTESDPKQCWGVSAPKETVNTKDGKPTTVRRGDILLFVTYDSTGKGVISFSGGYPFAGGSTVKMQVGDATFDLFTDGEWAWPSSPEEDAKILAALKAGAEAKLTASSAKGTKTEDTFSLDGFSAAVDEAAKRCG